jgi:hypothetical protein
MEHAPMLLTDKGKPDTTARHVLQVLAEYAHPDGSEARPSIMRIQYRTGYDRRTVQRALRRLEAGGLTRAEGTKNDCTVYRLAMKAVRPDSDWKALEMEEERQRDSDAERQRRSRARRVTHSNDVTVTDAESVTGRDVTHADDVSHALCVPTSRTQNPDVTDGTPPDPSFEPSGESSLSPSAASDRPQPAAGQGEREINASLSTDKDNDDPARVVQAWTTARGRGRNPAAEQKIHDSAVLLLSVDWTVADVIALAEDMAKKYPTGTDLAVHEAHWERPKVVAALPPWCGECYGEDLAERWRDNESGVYRCPKCNPYAANAA